MDNSNGTATQRPMSASRVCKTCDGELSGAEHYRSHVKSDSHVRKLRCRICRAGEIQRSAISPNLVTFEWPSSSESAYDEDSTISQDGDQEENVGSGFVPEKCLFCGISVESLDANMMHMITSHSFIIPHRNSLQVSSAISRRATIEAVQQHMVGKGHCRFDDNGGEMVDFYEPKTGEEPSFPPSSVRLVAQAPRHRAHRTRSHQPIVLDEQGDSPSSTTLLRREERMAAQVSGLSVKGQKWLMHLGVAEQRSVLARRRKDLEEARRREPRMKSGMEKMGNQLLMKHFKSDVPGRKWG